MRDEAIIRIAEQSAKVLAGMQFFMSCKYLLPSYHALLLAAKANHPDDPFLSALPVIEPEQEENGLAPPQLNILFTQLRLALESLQEEGGAGGAPPPPPSTSAATERRREILEQLREGKISAEQATALIEAV
jgi:hypothetical protein